jgi:hypothetical protein
MGASVKPSQSVLDSSVISFFRFFSASQQKFSDRANPRHSSYYTTFVLSTMLFLSRIASLLVASVVASAVTAASAEHLRDDYHKKKAVVFNKEKGFKCHGAGSSSEFDNECEGGMKMEFEMSIKPTDMIWNVVEEVHDQLHENFIPDVEFLTPSDEVLDDWSSMADEAAASQKEELLDEGKTWSMEFGGTARMEWSCKVTYSYKEGKLSKSAACGFKGSSKSGKKDSNQEDEHDQQLLAENAMLM